MARDTGDLLMLGAFALVAFVIVFSLLMAAFGGGG